MAEQNTNSKRIAKNTFFLYIRMILMMLISLYTSRVVLSTLGVMDYGIWNVVSGIIVLFSFITNSMTQATQRYLNFELGKSSIERQSKVFSTSVNIHIMLGILLVISSEIIGVWFLNNKMNIPADRMYAANWIFQFSIVSCFITVLSCPYNAAIIAHEKMGTFAWISILDAILKLIIVYILVIFKVDKLILYGFLILLVTLLDIGIYFYYSITHFKETKYSRHIEKTLLKEMFSFASFLMFGNIAYVCFTQGINILINIIYGPILNASRGIANQVASAVNKFFTNFQTALNPQITKSCATKDYDYLHKLIYASSKYSFFLLYIISFPIIIETDKILNLWLSEVPEYTVSFVRLVIAISVIDAISNPIGTSVIGNGKIKNYSTIMGSIMVSILPLSYISVKAFSSPLSIYYTHLVVITIAHNIRLIFAKKYIQLNIKQYFIKAIFPILYILTTSIVYYLINTHIQPNFYISIISSFSFACISVSLLGLSQNEKKFIVKKITTILNKNSK
jgi:O-antigen/teichoic acid export membrane protein